MQANLYIVFQGRPGCGKTRMKKKIAAFLRQEGFSIVNESDEAPCQIEVKVDVKEDPRQSKLPV